MVLLVEIVQGTKKFAIETQTLGTFSCLMLLFSGLKNCFTEDEQTNHSHICAVS